MSNMYIVGASILSFACAFFIGINWQKNKFKSMEVFLLEDPILLQSSPSDIGQLPAKSKLYLYRSLPEVKTYIMFVNVDLGGVKMKKVERPTGFVLSPISAYVEE